MASSNIKARYRRLLLRLLPQGRAWQKTDDSLLSKFMDSVADEFCRVDERGQVLLNTESDPRLTSELLTDWEFMVGIPDECTDLAATQGDRQNQVVQKLTLIGEQSASFFEGLAATLGFTIVVDNFDPFLVGKSKVGDRLTNDAWVYYFLVTADEFLLNPFKVGQGVVGDRLVEFGNETLECTIKKYAPAHTTPIFAFGGGF